MTQADLSSLFPFPVVPFFYDTTYAKPTSDWLFNKFYPWYSKTKGSYARKHDCDNFARRVVVECQDAHADSSDTNEGLAVGEFCYLANSEVKGPHAIVCAVTDEGLVFMEPQNGKKLTLTPQEIQSCFRVSF